MARELKKMASVLVLDDEKNIRKILCGFLETGGHEPIEAESLSDAQLIILQGKIDVVITDLRLEKEDGSQLLRWMREKSFLYPVIVLTAHGSIDSAVECMKRGAFDYLSKPFERSELLAVVQKAVLEYETNRRFSVPLDEEDVFVGVSPQMAKVNKLIEKVAPTESNVLIWGESGTGKELIAQLIHEKSQRSSAPLVKLNCAALPESLLESELFGYEKGAFTGAYSTKLGRFELAQSGTLFLDEVGEMSPEMQVKLLRVLQEKTFERVGGIKTHQADVRLVAATNKNLEEEVKNGRFRGDLFYRLNVLPIYVAPLRERKEDISPLMSHLALKVSKKLKRPVPRFSHEAISALTHYSWPGNIRELENTLERLLILSSSEILNAEDLPSEIHQFEDRELLQQAVQQEGGLKEKVKTVTRKVEKKAIEEALVMTGNNVTRAAQLLDVSRKGLQLKMKELGIRE